MYQFYYSNGELAGKMPIYQHSIENEFVIERIRPTMWEEHCLECSAPVCYSNCVLYESRIDGRCKRFYDGMYVYNDSRGCCGQGMRVKFRKWSNMMSVIYPGYLTKEQYRKLSDKNQLLGEKLKELNRSHLPVFIKWNLTRIIEYIRRNALRTIRQLEDKADAFVFHGYSFCKTDFRLIVEIYSKDNQSVFKFGMTLHYGENIVVISTSQLDYSCWEINNLVKVYPENNIEAELDILWCDFVKGNQKEKSTPAPKVKCLVWDLDNTLWNGTLIETENVKELSVVTETKEIIKKIDERGILQSIASKNDFEQAWAVIEENGLSEYFLYPQIHWNAKSVSMRNIANDLNIGIDTIALIDDSFFERNQVTMSYPQIRTYDATEIGLLLEKEEFNVPITEEGKNRRLMYKAEQKRKIVMQNSDLDTIEFLKSCDLKAVLFSPETEDEIERCFELVQRTNQLNMSGIKYNTEQFEHVLKMQDARNIAFFCSDKYGKYGIVGFGQYLVSNQTIEFKEFAMSCRIAGKYVESAVFSYILQKEHCDKGIFRVVKTKKNGLLRNTLKSIGFEVIGESEDVVNYSFTSKLEHNDLVCVLER